MDQNGDFGTGARMIVAALISAAITATVVIAVGQTLIDRAAPASSAATSASGGILIRAGG